MIRIRDITMPPGHTPAQLRAEAQRLIKADVCDIKIVKKSIDARKKPDVKIIYTVDIRVEGSEQRVLKKSGCKKASIASDYRYDIPRVSAVDRPVIVGFGPAGMFCALVLAKAGLRPIVTERGEDAETRHKKVREFFEGGRLDTDSNVQFGEGGAGTFSDGKLNTNVNNPRIRWILEQFVLHGAKENILYDAKPHIGTDILLNIVQNIRKTIISLGGEIRFNTKLTGILTNDGKVTGAKLSNGEVLPCSQLVLAIGHSARDTFRMLDGMGIPIEPKPFSMGVRIEHLQKDIDLAQYGTPSPFLPAADYKLVSHLEGRSVYTFCMCPGGYVVAAASEDGKVVTNGMSFCARDGENANSALLVTLNPNDFKDKSALGGMILQEELERKAFEAGGGDYRAPAQLLGDFLCGKESTGQGKVTPTYRPGVKWCDLNDILPKEMAAALKEGITDMERRLQGFSDPEAVLTAVESRSSSPVRIKRDENRQSDLKGLFPAGEGAGYAGGIMSAAIDGMMCAEEIIRSQIL